MPVVLLDGATKNKGVALFTPPVSVCFAAFAPKPKRLWICTEKVMLRSLFILLGQEQIEKLYWWNVFLIVAVFCMLLKMCSKHGGSPMVCSTFYFYLIFHGWFFSICGQFQMASVFPWFWSSCFRFYWFDFYFCIGKFIFTTTVTKKERKENKQTNKKQVGFLLVSSLEHYMGVIQCRTSQRWYPSTPIFFKSQMREN